MRRATARGPTRRLEVRRGFTIEVAGLPGALPFTCGEILGFRESLLASGDPRVQAPLRLGLLGTSIELDTWLDAWSEDDVQVRRSITVRRNLDDKAVTVIATLASHGYGVDPSVVVESVSIPRGKLRKISRSGTYLKVDVATALGDHVVGGENTITAIEPTFG